MRPAGRLTRSFSSLLATTELSALFSHISLSDIFEHHPEAWTLAAPRNINRDFGVSGNLPSP
jgi:hypothetical protein